MNKKNREKLRVRNPEFYDATENRVVVTQEHSLIELFRGARAEGSSIAMLIGSFGLFLSTILTLASADTFKEIFGISAPSWEAIFTIIAFLSALVMVWKLVVLIIRWRQKKLLSADVVKSKFFSEDNKMQGKPNKIAGKDQ